MSNKKIVEAVEKTMEVNTVNSKRKVISPTRVTVGKKAILQTGDDTRYVFIKALGGKDWYFSHRFYPSRELEGQRNYSNHPLPETVDVMTEESLGGYKMEMSKPIPEVTFDGKEIVVTSEMIEKQE